MLMPYLQFSGDCEEAFAFYLEAFGGGTSHLVRYSDAPKAFQDTLPAEQRNKIMHGQIGLGEYGHLSGADAIWPFEKGSAISIHVHMPSEAAAKAVYAKMAEGGEVLSELLPNSPPDDDGVSGMVKDKFGFVWLFSAMRDKQ